MLKDMQTNRPLTLWRRAMLLSNVIGNLKKLIKRAEELRLDAIVRDLIV